MELLSTLFYSYSFLLYWIMEGNFVDVGENTYELIEW